MKKHQAIIFLLLLLVGIVYYFIISKKNKLQKDNSTSSGDLVFQKLDINKIKKIIIIDKDKKINLKFFKNNWVVEERSNYSANYGKISNLLKKISEVKINQLLQNLNSKQLDRLELSKPRLDKKDVKNTGKYLEFFDSVDKSLGYLLIGKSQSTSGEMTNRMGSYETGKVKRFIVTNKIKKNQALLIAEDFVNVNIDPSEWLDKTFFKINKLKSITSSYTNKENQDDGWTFYREKEEESLILKDLPKNKDLNKENSNSIESAFSGPNFKDISLEKKLKGKNIITFDITTFDNFTYQIKVGEKTKENLYPLSINVQAKIPKSKKKPRINKSKKQKKSISEKKLSEAKEKYNKKLEKYNKYNKEREAILAKYENEKKLHNHIFMVNEWSINSLIKKRSEFIIDKKVANPPTQKKVLKINN